MRYHSSYKIILQSTLPHANKTTKGCIQFLNDLAMYVMRYNNSYRDTSTITLKSCEFES